MHQNIAGLMNKIDLLVIQLDELAGEKNYVDIMCISEHFIY